MCSISFANKFTSTVIPTYSSFDHMPIIETKFGVFCILEQYSAMWVGSMTLEHIDYIGGPSNKVRLFVLLSIHSG